MNRFYKIILAGLILVVATSCGKNDSETDALASAQKCLDDVPDSNPAAASACFSIVSAYSDQQADILKCSILMTSGGLTNSKIVTAYNALKDPSQTSKVAAFMAALSLDVPDVNTAYNTAVQADQYCVQSGVTGLVYISGIIVSGTFMSMTVGGIDVTDPAAVTTAISTLISDCTGSTTSSCPNISTLGSTVSTLASSYCSSSGADASVCSQVNGAVASAGGNSTAVGQAILCYMNNQTYNASTGSCQ